MNKVTFTDLEIDLWEACNLRCAQCTHCAPLFNSQDEQYSYESLEHDLAILGQFAHVAVLRIVGGEPLLNKRLVEFLQLIRKSEICDKLTLFTNGILLNKVDDQIFTYLDRLGVSVYNLDERTLQLIEQNVEEIKKKFPKLDVTPNRIKSFTKYHLVERNDNTELVKQIYDNCNYSYNQGGFSIFNGRLYRCFMARKLYKFLKANENIVSGEFEHFKKQMHDSIALTESLSMEEFKRFVEDKTPLESCQWCLGCSGKTFPQHQLRPGESDVATLEDLDFEEGKRYLSNALLSWSLHGDKTNLEENEHFNASYIRDYAKHFTTQCFGKKT